MSNDALGRLHASTRDAAALEPRDHDHDGAPLAGAHYSHAWDDGECSRCFMRDYWPGAKARCPLG